MFFLYIIGLVPDNLIKTWVERTKFMTRRKLEMTIILLYKYFECYIFQRNCCFSW